MELVDPTTVRITLSRQHEPRFLAFLGAAPDDRDDIAFPGLVVLTFDVWNVPEPWNFHCPDIPFLGSHDGGVAYGPHRMCGNGDRCMESPSDSDERLCVILSEPSGLPDTLSLHCATRYLAFEGLCRERMEKVPEGAP